ncbi:hypothetical protein Amet_2052 [Alkaliphilus metalliredigens QYMF]|uniref:Aminotransferase, class I and II n=1 Tax=Alkaliphilus metalliredigens (strain QYMF) TaxID=293826 RepID=A6TPU5_ALKMQ|nr:hypothetical protein [Alkaliphilus metalliredigens]ABR48213.1 hypothetical protein Amet_2052 [Alkaliphilus metalliredigens QYMF]
MFINRITQMLEMRGIQNRYCGIYGKQPYNVSNWLSSSAYSNAMLSKMKMPETKTLEYVYTYSMDKKILNRVKKKLDPSTGDEMGITFVDNGTQAIITLVNMIKQYKYKKICIINPAYFSIAQALKAFSIEYDEINLKRTNGQYVLPYEELVKAHYDVIWITSPIFSTSVYHSQETENMIHDLMDRGTLIISDECFCVPGNELIRRVKNRNNFIAIYSPHKSLCLNTFKFASIIYPERFDTFIEHWVDVLTGNLPASSLSAITHFLDSNYDECQKVYRKFMTTAGDEVQSIIRSKDNVESDNIITGSLLTLYFNNLTFDQIKSYSFIEDVIFSTGKAFYPSFLNGLDETFGFAFRINLALYDKEFLSSLDRLVCHLSAI